MFVRNRSTRRTLRFSISGHENHANGGSSQAAISAGGRYVAFTSNASNLVRRDVNGRGSDVFVRDLTTARTFLVSARGDRPPPHLDPAALHRGPNSRIVYLIRDTIRDGKQRIAAPTWGSHEALWKTSAGYLLRDRRGSQIRLVFVDPRGNKRVLARSPGFIGTAVSLTARLVAWDKDVDDEGVRKVVKIANPDTGRVLASHRFRRASVVAVNRSWVLIAQGIRTPAARTFWWNYKEDVRSHVYDQAAIGVDLRHAVPPRPGGPGPQHRRAARPAAASAIPSTPRPAGSGTRPASSPAAP